VWGAVLSERLCSHWIVCENRCRSIAANRSKPVESAILRSIAIVIAPQASVASSENDTSGSLSRPLSQRTTRDSYSAHRQLSALGQRIYTRSSRTFKTMASRGLSRPYGVPSSSGKRRANLLSDGLRIIPVDPSVHSYVLAEVRCVGVLAVVALGQIEIDRGDGAVAIDISQEQPDCN
jgi:hypothetical protein